MKNNINKTVTVVGLGYVGYPLLQALLAANKYKVFGYDVNESRIDQLRQIPSKGTKTVLTSDAKECLPQSDVILVCVPTPLTPKNKPDFSYLKKAVTSVATYLKKGQLVIIESTIYPGVCEEMVLPILEKSGLIGGRDFFLSHCPERINPGDPQWNVTNIPRNVGGLTKKCAVKTARFYHSFLEAPIHIMNSLKEVESTKLVENVFRDLNIAFANELAQGLAKMGVDAVNVLEAAANKPFSFLLHYPGCGVGGDCIATDPYYYLELMKKNNFSAKLVETARAINLEMPTYTVQVLSNSLKLKSKQLKNTKVAVLGLSYKAGIRDTRNSPALAIVDHLTKLKVSYVTFDPLLPELSMVKSLEQALSFAEAVIVTTADPFFIKKLSPKLLKQHDIRFVIDGRNCLKKNSLVGAGISYHGIGR